MEATGPWVKVGLQTNGVEEENGFLQPPEITGLTRINVMSCVLND